MSEFVMGYIDTNIHYCPYCGEHLTIKNYIGDTVCDNCGKAFCVIEGENDLESEENK